MSDNNRYTYRAEWSPEDDEYVGLVAEFPSLSWLAPTAGEAIAGAERLVDDILADMAETGENPPVPLTERRYSGNISFRTSPDHHRRLAIEAAEQGVSINQWMVQRLTTGRAEHPGTATRELHDVIRSIMEKSQAETAKMAQEMQHKHAQLAHRLRLLWPADDLHPDLLPGAMTLAGHVGPGSWWYDELQSGSALPDDTPFTVVVVNGVKVAARSDRK